MFFLEKNYMYFSKLMFESGMIDDLHGGYYTKGASPPVEAAIHYSYFTIFHNLIIYTGKKCSLKLSLELLCRTW